jgi:hypothetical protein
MKHGYLKNGAVPIPDTFWVLVSLGYYCLRTPVPRRTQKISTKKKKKKRQTNIFFHFFFWICHKNR